MNYQRLLQNHKVKLIRQLAIKRALIQKYAIDGYISHKKIGQKVYSYLQFRDKNGLITSVYLSAEDLEIYQEAIEQKNLINRRIESINRDLALFDSVMLTGEQIDSDSIRLPETFRGYRMLNGAVGISPKYHALFRIYATNNEHDYFVKATYKRHRYAAPIAYVTELNVSDISTYMTSAGYTIDKAIRDDGNPAKEKYSLTLKGKTDDGISFTVDMQEEGYLISYMRKRKKYCFAYAERLLGLDDDMKRFIVSSEIKKHMAKMEMDNLTRRYYGE